MGIYLLVLTAGLARLPAAADRILNLGDPAPPIAVSKWIKGEEIASFDPGRIYVVEFWATWCAPCRESIPHLTELAHAYRGRGVRFVGVDVWEQDTSKVKPFVDAMGERMDYGVALDRVPDGRDVLGGAMARAWMEAAAEYGIPAAFVVRDGKIAWIGDPMALDGPLAKIVAGDWDPKPLAAERLAARAAEKKKMDVQRRVRDPLRAKDYAGCLGAIREVTAADPTLDGTFDVFKFMCLNRLGRSDEALALGRKMAEASRDDAGTLSFLALTMLDPELDHAPDARLVRFGVEAARRANDLSRGDDIGSLDAYACALYRTGDAPGAIAAVEKAVGLCNARFPSKEHPFHRQLEGHLATFRKAAGKAGTP
ncbi:Thiol-disulfide oxidoreductase ResA [Aquisphaera giovannonii]|uniref:Thiol-disulfide oxidoreductase ResA n=1 Tax=Aquisphaera giovannonii TaxID=406548 RepID=A0A5B9W3S4_9BACT|nr:TlpA disulfide reductase family protein [Aquisphaera giovannonii]QEH34761.1 Thiol-disulfide oxidoreductase ResA [Aquisphaera giovannonii]